MLKVGAPAPEIDLAGSDGERFRLTERKTPYAVVYFFPKAFTPGCTKEAIRFRDNGTELAALGATVVGISTDALTTQCDFAAKLEVSFPLLSDSSGVVTRAYGVMWPLIALPRRATFIVGPKQTIEASFWHEVQISKHLDEVVGYLRKARSAGARP